MLARGGLLGFAVFLLLGVLARSAHAERIVIVSPDGSQPTLIEVFNRLRGELRMRGFETLLVSEEGPMNQAELRRIAALGQADAAVAIEQVEGEPTCHVWFADNESGRDRLMSLSVPENDEAPTLLALRSVELLRSSLRERAPPAPAPPRRARNLQTEPGTSLSSRPAAPPDTSVGFSRYSLRLGATVMWVASEQPASLALAPSFAYGVATRLALAARVVFATSPNRVETMRAQGEVHTDLALLELRWLAAQPHRSVRFELSGAVGLARCAAKGLSSPGSSVQGRTAVVWPMSFGAGGEGWFSLVSHWRIGFISAFGMLAPKPLLRVDQTDTVLGRPWFEIGTGLEYAIR